MSECVHLLVVVFVGERALHFVCGLVLRLPARLAWQQRRHHWAVDESRARAHIRAPTCPTAPWARSLAPT
eukprot:6170313-Pyramimonas_sp.AAC.1